MRRLVWARVYASPCACANFGRCCGQRKNLANDRVSDHYSLWSSECRDEDRRIKMKNKNTRRRQSLVLFCLIWTLCLRWWLLTRSLIYWGLFTTGFVAFWGTTQLQSFLPSACCFKTKNLFCDMKIAGGSSFTSPLSFCCLDQRQKWVKKQNVSEW